LLQMPLHPVAVCARRLRRPTNLTADGRAWLPARRRLRLRSGSRLCRRRRALPPARAIARSGYSGWALSRLPLRLLRRRLLILLPQLLPLRLLLLLPQLLRLLRLLLLPQLLLLLRRRCRRTSQTAATARRANIATGRRAAIADSSAEAE